MRYSLTLLAVIAFTSLISPFLIQPRGSWSSISDVTEQSAFEKREAAYRANNVGVALLEQYKPKEAIDSFKYALTAKPDLVLARINLSIALYYLPDTDGARREADNAL